MGKNNFYMLMFLLISAVALQFRLSLLMGISMIHKYIMKKISYEKLEAEDFVQDKNACVSQSVDGNLIHHP